MSKTILYKAGTRGRTDLGWLVSNQSFSFSDYYNPDRMGFGVLRVLNDDIVAGGKGFGWHPHDNMEIISIPLEGSLVHKDNLGNESVIRAGEIQVMSTGTGVFHSEYNNEPDNPAKFLQIWIFPKRLNVEPRYEQAGVDLDRAKNRLLPILSPEPGGEGVWIYQDAWFHLGKFDPGLEFEYKLKRNGNGIYLFAIRGSFQAEGQRLEARDALGVTGVQAIRLRSLEPDSELLVIDVPMNNEI
ncbi:MAG TPA: pirin family protein [Puia sp.]|nr:pirin family protein [Puia sp.]